MLPSSAVEIYVFKFSLGICRTDIRLFDYSTIDEVGGPVRFAEKYVCGDCGRDCDMERKYAGKKRARKMKKLRNENENHWKAIENHLRHIGAAGREQVSDFEPGHD